MGQKDTNEMGVPAYLANRQSDTDSPSWVLLVNRVIEVTSGVI